MSDITTISIILLIALFLYLLMGGAKKLRYKITTLRPYNDALDRLTLAVLAKIKEKKYDIKLSEYTIEVFDQNYQRVGSLWISNYPYSYGFFYVSLDIKYSVSHSTSEKVRRLHLQLLNEKKSIALSAHTMYFEGMIKQVEGE